MVTVKRKYHTKGVTKRHRTPAKRPTRHHQKLLRRFHHLNGQLVLWLALIVVLGLIFWTGNLIRSWQLSHPAAIQVQTPAQQHQKFIKKIAPAAIDAGQTYNVLPSITIAQAILESDWGTSQLAQRYHNLFGVKSDDPTQSQVLQTQEYQNGQWMTVSARFKTYLSWEDSIRDHNLLLAQGTSWNAHQYQHVLAANNYQQAAQALQQDGYATDPGYTRKLIDLIEKYQLNQYDPK